MWVPTWLDAFYQVESTTESQSSRSQQDATGRRPRPELPPVQPTLDPVSRSRLSRRPAGLRYGTVWSSLGSLGPPCDSALCIMFID